MNRETKRFPAFQLKIDESLGVVEHIIAVVGNVDHGYDRIHNGAFAKTILERGGKVKVLDNHRSDSVMAAIGKSLELREIGRNQLPPELLAEFPDATGALVAKTQFLMSTEEGRGAFIRIRDGAVDEYSIGYEPIKGATEFTQREGLPPVREMKEIKLYEYSPVLFGMNSATMTISSKKVNGDMDLPIADRNREWDATKADERVRAWAGGPDTETIRWDDYKKAFFYFDPENDEEFGGYKLGFADIVDGKLTAIPRGIFAVAGGRGVDAADIPDLDKDRIKRRVTRYYGRMAEQFEDDTLESPFDKSGYSEEAETKDLMLSDIHENMEKDFANQFSLVDNDGRMALDMWIRDISLDPKYVIVCNYRQDTDYNYYRVAYDQNEEVTYDTPLISGGIVDSFSMVSLKRFLENKYQISIPDEKATPEAFDTVDSIVELVKEFTADK